MVRHVKPISEIIENEKQPRRRHSVSQPPDNIGVSCTVQTDNSKEVLITGRRRALAIPRDNIGIACLPTAERLGNILEVPEYESSDEDGNRKPAKLPQNRKSTLTPANASARARINSPSHDIVDQTTTSSTESDSAPNKNQRYERGRSCKRRDTPGLLWQECAKESSKRGGESKKMENKLQDEIGISNVRRPRDDPTKPRKPIMPRDNIGFACRPLHKSTGRLSGPRLSTGINLKNSSNGMERKNIFHTKPPTASRNEKITGEQIKTLRTNHRYGEIFDSCPPQDVHE